MYDYDAFLLALERIYRLNMNIALAPLLHQQLSNLANLIALHGDDLNFVFAYSICDGIGESLCNVGAVWIPGRIGIGWFDGESGRVDEPHPRPRGSLEQIGRQQLGQLSNELLLEFTGVVAMTMAADHLAAVCNGGSQLDNLLVAAIVADEIDYRPIVGGFDEAFQWRHFEDVAKWALLLGLDDGWKLQMVNPEND
ncbi:hypothetical protein IQ07DRAFT_597802 [Pyrenochaeta sp. DS3sAY3a]|nr:hypothetical protein IQ07DRAFT_597802 [Pyrenochaeta sp. DS3sAY3a]